MSKPWIGVDLDGTLAEYTSWQGIEYIGEPIKPMIDRIHGWLADGLEVKIFTARVSVDEPNIVRHIEDWCVKHIGFALPITCRKDFAMVQLWDDRCVQVIKNTGQPVVPKE